MLASLLILSFAAFALTHVLCEHMQFRLGIYLTKPLSMLLLWLWLYTGPSDSLAGYKQAILWGLALSALGDVFLMLPSAERRDYFIPGLLSFLSAHLIYIYAFCLQLETLVWPMALGMLLYSGLILRLLWPSLGALRLPVLCYVLVISAMCASALSWAWEAQNLAAGAAAAGSLLFAISDTLLAFQRFTGPFPAAGASIMTSYFAAQLLIASSVLL